MCDNSQNFLLRQQLQETIEKGRMFSNSTKGVELWYCFNSLQGIKGLPAINNEATCPKDSFFLWNPFCHVLCLPKIFFCQFCCDQRELGKFDLIFLL